MATMQTLFNLLAAQRNRSSRYARYLMIQIAGEYFVTGDYPNCLSYLNQVLPYYKQECWTPLLESIVHKGLSAAYCSASSVDFIRFAYEYLGHWNDRPLAVIEQRKLQVQRALNELFASKPPNQLDFLAHPDQLPTIHNAWVSVLQESVKRNQITFKASNYLAGFIQMRCSFVKPDICADVPAILRVHLLLNTPMPIKFTRLKVLFTNEYYNPFCSLDLQGQELQPNQMYPFEFRFKPNPSDVQSQIQVSGVSLHFGQEPFLVTCSWILDRSEAHQLQRRNGFIHQRLQSSFNDPVRNEFECIQHCSSLQVQNKKARAHFELQHEPQVFLNENYPFLIRIQNDECNRINDLVLTIRLQREVINGNNGDEFVNQFTIDGQPLDKDFENKCSLYRFDQSIESGSWAEKRLFMLSQFVGKFSLAFYLQYSIELNDSENPHHTFKYTCETSQFIECDCSLPFQSNFSITNQLNAEIQCIRLLEPFRLIMRNKSQWNGPLQINSIRLELNKNFSIIEDSELRQHPWKIDSDSILECSVRLVCNNEDSTCVDPVCGIGSMWICWEKFSSKVEYPENMINIFLPDVYVKPSLLFVEANYPEYGITRCPMIVKYTIHNRTESVLPLQFSVETSHSFMFSGNKQIKISIQARKYWQEHVVLYPLVCGYVGLPKIRLIAFPDTNMATHIDPVLDTIPAFLDIMPQEKPLKSSKSIM